MAKKEKKSKRYDHLKEMARLTRLMKEMYERGQSELCEVRNSEIHGRGVYAAEDIEKETQVIEYIGEYIDKDESEKRAWDQAVQWRKKPGMQRCTFSPLIRSGTLMATCRGMMPA